MRGEKKKKAPLSCNGAFELERQKGVEPSSSAWKAEIMSRYMTAASMFRLYHK